MEGFKKIPGFGKNITESIQSIKKIPKLSKDAINEEGMKILDFIGSVSVDPDCRTPGVFEHYENVNSVYLNKYQGFIPPFVIKKILDLLLYVK